MRHVHLGLGRFHRAHQAVYLQNAGWKITAFSMRSAREAKSLQDVGHKYTLIETGAGSHRETVITAIDEALFLQDHKERFFELVSGPKITTLSLTITEKGYGDDSPSATIEILTLALHQRQQLHRIPINVLSCDNLIGNGDLLESLCRTVDREHDYGLDFNLVSFPNSMVDRIVPAGDDPSVVQTEEFHQWVVEDKFLGQRPDWEQQGLYLVADVEPFERLKLSLLNGSHSFLAYYGQLQGHEFVHEAVNDRSIRERVKQLFFEEVGPLLDVPAPLTLEEYGNALLRRFDNPQLAHRLDQIAMDGSKKVPIRFLPFYHESSVLRLAVSAWFTYVWLGLGQMAEFKVVDPLAGKLRHLRTDDFGSTVQRWLELLDWPSLEVEFLGTARR